MSPGAQTCLSEEFRGKRFEPELSQERVEEEFEGPKQTTRKLRHTHTHECLLMQTDTVSTCTSRSVLSVAKHTAGMFRNVHVQSWNFNANRVVSELELNTLMRSSLAWETGCGVLKGTSWQPRHADTRRHASPGLSTAHTDRKSVV